MVNGDRKSVRVDVADIVSVSACADLTLPPGAGLCIDTVHGPVYLVRIIHICLVVPHLINLLLPAFKLPSTGMDHGNILDNVD